MRITPRKGEVADIVALLEDPQYESGEALAKDVIKRVAELFAEREWFCYAWRTGPGAPVLAWGPLTSETEVKRFATKAELGGEHLAIKLFSTASMLDRIEQGAKGVSKHCLNCTHPIGAHEHPTRSNQCVVGGCHCKEIRKS